jgi:hypothetical protein
MTKLKKVLEKNIEFDQLQKILNILNGKNKSIDGLLADTSSSELPFFKLAPISFLDMECFFPKYKNILANWRSFKLPILRKYLIVQCNAQGN